jgi:tripartite-type tricarboxylate transporter receptor subunit TctC
MKDWKLELDDEEIWWLDDALRQAEVRQHELAARMSDASMRPAYLMGAERFRLLREERLRPLVELMERVRAAGRPAAPVDPEETDAR